MAQRLALRERPASFVVGRQRWNHLLFCHWKIAAAEIQATLPPGLFVDTFEGDAYLGVVPFFMQRVRPAWLPPLPAISWFLELNVRTYVFDAGGRPGVWFYSLDCNQPVAVSLARRFFHLPYFHAEMSSGIRDGTVFYRSQRCAAGAPVCEYAWRSGPGSSPAQPGSLEFFLAERYLLFAADPAGRLFEGRVHHAPYRLFAPEVTQFSAGPGRQAGFFLTGEPVSLLGAAAVDVSIFPLSPLKTGAPAKAFSS
ncbi:MAG: DUF2071 domain-containing protein [Verrucomicrobia bacterium]|nr:DUF2071 domain-containing protein [Verrucomicrobiota bacterium]